MHQGSGTTPEVKPLALTAVTPSFGRAKECNIFNTAVQYRKASVAIFGSKDVHIWPNPLDKSCSGFLRLCALSPCRGRYTSLLLDLRDRIRSASVLRVAPSTSSHQRSTGQLPKDCGGARPDTR